MNAGTRALIVGMACLGLTGCFESKPDVVQGYVEGDFVDLGLPLGGQVVAVEVSRGDHVKAGQVVFRLDAQSETAALAEADARLVQTQAELVLAEVELRRQRALTGTSAALEAKLDTATASAASAVGAVTAAQAVKDRAIWTLAQRVAYAPADARVEDILFQTGEVISAGQSVARLLPPGHVVIRAYLGAAMVARLPAGTQTKIQCEGCGVDATAVVAFVSGEAAYAPPILYSRDNRDKLSFLVELRPDATTAPQLRPGQPVDILPPKVLLK
ncbi:MAG: HlyD family efflux transporter periplasmic adaptor subunit [Rhodospirillaceae bacterium]|nr:HlyD family efflux transporter periplasmic adaptor subunit [Rhodospirillaceae bacterium]